MTAYILQVVWPIDDNTMSMPELIEEAADTLPEFEREHHATITGPGVWSKMHGSKVPGWTSYSGWVLIGRLPAEPDPLWMRWRAGVDTDRVRIDEALAGRREYEQLGEAEKPVVVMRLHHAGKTDKEIGEFLRAKEMTIRRCRQRANARARELTAELAS